MQALEVFRLSDSRQIDTKLGDYGRLQAACPVDDSRSLLGAWSRASPPTSIECSQISHAPSHISLVQGVGVVMQIQAATYRGNKSGSYNFLFSFGDHRCQIWLFILLFCSMQFLTPVPFSSPPPQSRWFPSDHCIQLHSNGFCKRLCIHRHHEEELFLVHQRAFRSGHGNRHELHGQYQPA